MRTQILLDPVQHRWLTAKARRSHKSLSQVLRELVDEQRTVFGHARRDDPLFSLVGLGRDSTTDVAERHDVYLYRAKPSKRRK